ncbi:hypothetical protein PanWU01x14_016080 [Parasponia andersonii]|uniref:Uncharacterized protein n=1 Tax=Parasponia andersonii TaxID=3476 RepID=A0A2P5E0R4_PARAD|nr:hypothetical protein PanWU01x14_016080 [Parasponia andersonii]
MAFLQTLSCFSYNQRNILAHNSKSNNIFRIIATLVELWLHPANKTLKAYHDKSIGEQPKAFKE